VNTDDPIARFRRAVLDAEASFEALVSHDSLSSLRDAVSALNETSAKRALLAAAIERHGRDLSAAQQFQWMSADGRLDFDFFDLEPHRRGSSS
jgi:hypothetical protein